MARKAIDEAKLSYILNKFAFTSNDENEYKLKINDFNFKINKLKHKWSIDNVQCGNKNIFNLENNENFSVLILIIQIAQQGYLLSNLELEKKWQLGHESEGGRLDVFIKNERGQSYWMIEVKDKKEYEKYLNIKGEKLKQIFSYFAQEKETKFISYYTFDFNEGLNNFSSVEITDSMRISPNLNDIIDNWDKNFDDANYLLNNPYNIEKNYIKDANLKKLTTKNDLIGHFLTILRIYTVSDKSNAFDKLINLLIAKIYDELNEDSAYNVESLKGKINIQGKKFQFLNEIDTPESFLSRLYDLYKAGVQFCLDKKITDYSDEEFWEATKKDSKYEELFKIFQDLRLKKDNTFAFVEVFDENSFNNNYIIVKEIVEFIQKYRFKYNNKKQFLGDIFEELLNESWKQEAGQFFTPLPIVEMMTKSLPIEESINANLNESSLKHNFIPKILDYACGSGHFLINAMEIIQTYLDSIAISSISSNFYRNLLSSFQTDKFKWAKDCIYGIEKDYRLTKTSKIASFLNGDGDATILNADALGKFSSEVFRNTVFWTENNRQEIFDFIISNPPYSVKGFMKNLVYNKISEKDGTYELLEEINLKDTRIESLFVERTFQLLKPNGIAAIILPQSFLTNESYSKVRKWMLERFYIKSIFSSGPNSFSGTTTSPAVIFLQKSNKLIQNFSYQTYLIHSPIMLGLGIEEERNFLGYEFSSNKNKVGIQIKNFNLSEVYSKNFIK